MATIRDVIREATDCLSEEETLDNEVVVESDADHTLWVFQGIAALPDGRKRIVFGPEITE